MSCWECDHIEVCHSFCVIEVLMDKVKMEMEMNVDGWQDPNTYIYSLPKSAQEDIKDIEDSVKRFEDNISKTCKHYKEKTPG